MQFNAIDFNGFEFKRSRSFSDLAQRNILNSFFSDANRLLTILYFNLRITGTGTDSQVGLKFSYIEHFV